MQNHTEQKNETQSDSNSKCIVLTFKKEHAVLLHRLLGYSLDYGRFNVIEDNKIQFWEISKNSLGGYGSLSFQQRTAEEPQIPIYTIQQWLHNKMAETEVWEDAELATGTKIIVTSLSRHDSHEPLEIIGKHAVYNGNCNITLGSGTSYDLVEGFKVIIKPLATA